MDDAPASPRSKLLEQIYVRGSDTVIRISDDAVILKTTRKGGIKLPDDMKVSREASGVETNRYPSGDEVKKQIQDAIADVEAIDLTATQSDRMVTEEDLKILSQNIRDDWRSLALCHLNLSATDVENIIRDNPNLEDQVFFMLCLWKVREGNLATVKNLTAKLDKDIEKEKWEFLMQVDPLSEEKHDEYSARVKTETNETTAENRSRSSSIDSGDEPLPPISLVNGGGYVDVTVKEDTPFEENEPIAEREPIGEFEIRDEKRDGGTLEDIERLSAVYTGFAEEKKDEFTSIGASMGDILQKVLILDHENKKLKNRVTEMKEEKELADALLASSQHEERKEPQPAPRRDESTKQTTRRKHTDEDFQKQRDNYLKVKGHLKEAIDANREWDAFGRQQRDKHKKEMSEKDAIIKSLESKLQIAESSSSDQSRQMDSILNATESQVTDMQEDMEKLRAERSNLKERLRRLLEEKRQVENLSKNLLKQNATSGGKMALTKDQRRAQNRIVGQTATVVVPEEFEVPSESYQEVLRMVQSNAKAPPNDDYRSPRDRAERSVKKLSKTAKAPPENTPVDDVFFLKEQVLQYRKDFEKERKDREKAAGELESLRRELDDTKLMLNLQRQEYQGRNTGTTAKYGGDRTERHKSKKHEFTYMDPDELASYLNQTDGVNGPHWAEGQDEVDCGSSMWSGRY